MTIIRFSWSLYLKECILGARKIWHITLAGFKRTVLISYEKRNKKELSVSHNNDESSETG